ncbi:MAG: type II toxin-antitoxin system VapB family antitoxin [candidate division NC10 bacterium]|nr:type II toxin-antitoxin system VapB family antitoxin [candidate division NC10 bacterium]MBI2116413.1 type II toxin-antitoxin system VapB family antitoxin [candidate division NC10 bacterium]MBI2456212.1 type II toxin-antitoxin system VapB family antitoxin [candidate division NC10 bacterium]MBI3086432.1 type II toxin-antitoxin system VapB family antitoxin [candidate division NC10 bacterium]
MKTTVEIPDSLLDEARRVAAREGRTVRALVEEGLRKVLAERKRSLAFRLRRASFKGEGLQPDVAGASWERIRDLAYEGRGA